MKIAAAIIVAGVLGFWAWTHHERTVTEHRLEAVADVLAGRPVGVTCRGSGARCWTSTAVRARCSSRSGVRPDHMFLTRGVCGRLNAFIGARSHHDLDCLATIDWTRWSIDADYDGDCERHARADVEAINTLVHESMHLRGITSEAQAQCYAIQGDAWTVVRLGGTPRMARPPRTTCSRSSQGFRPSISRVTATQEAASI